MTTLETASDQVLQAKNASGKPLAVILTGHDGSGKSTMWTDRLASISKGPLINADRIDQTRLKG